MAALAYLAVELDGDIEMHRLNWHSACDKGGLSFLKVKILAWNSKK